MAKYTQLTPLPFTGLIVMGHSAQFRTISPAFLHNCEYCYILLA